MENSSIVFGIENYCHVKFVGPEGHDNQYHWFSNRDVPLKNGYQLVDIISSGKRVYSIEGLEMYYVLTYKGTTYYFEDLNLSTYHLNKYSLSPHYQRIGDNIGQYMFLIDAGDYGRIPSIRISPEVMEDVGKGRAIILFNTSYEPYSNEKLDYLRILNLFADKYGLKKENFKIVTGNLIVENDPNLNFEFIPYCYFLEHPWFVMKESFMGEKYPEFQMEGVNLKFKEKKEEFLEINKTIVSFDKKILCYQRRAHPHRRYIFYRLFHNKFLYDNSYSSLNNSDQKFLIDYETQFGETFDESVRINNFYIENQFVKEWSFDGNDLDYNLATDFDETFFKKTFVSLISETTSYNEVIFFSEKIFKPIYACQPFILISSKGSLNKLKEMGFKTFDKWWDESYDGLETLKERYDAIEKILTDLCNKTDPQLINMLNEMEEILSFNYDLFTQTKNENFYKTFGSIELPKTWKPSRLI
jgi:hypothetical protein